MGRFLLVPGLSREVSSALRTDETGATVIVLFWGDPAPYVGDAHAAGL